MCASHLLRKAENMRRFRSRTSTTASPSFDPSSSNVITAPSTIDSRVERIENMVEEQERARLELQRRVEALERRAMKSFASPSLGRTVSSRLMPPEDSDEEIGGGEFLERKLMQK